MADINVERKGGVAWLWWVLGLVLLALVVWWIAGAGTDDDADVALEEPVAVPVVTEPTTPTPTATPGIAEVLATPSAFFGQSFSTGPVQVAEVASDRGFWVEGDTGQRLFVVKNESPEEGTADVEGQADQRASRDVNAGERLQIQGMLYDGDSLEAVQPPLDDRTRQALEGQPIFLQAGVADIQHIQ